MSLHIWFRLCLLSLSFAPKFEMRVLLVRFFQQMEDLSRWDRVILHCWFPASTRFHKEYVQTISVCYRPRTCWDRPWFRVYGFHSCALYHEVSRSELRLYLRYHFQSLPKIHEHEARDELRLLYQPAFPSPCSTFRHSWIPPQGTSTSRPAAVYCLCFLERHKGSVFLVLIFIPAWSHAFEKSDQVHVGDPIQRIQYQIVRRKQTVYPAVSNSDILVDWVVSVYLNHYRIWRAGQC